LDTHRRAVAVGDDHRLEGCAVQQLAVGHQSVGLVRSIQSADGEIDVAALAGRYDVVYADLSNRQLIRIKLHADGIFLGTEHVDLGNAAHHGDALRQDRLGKLVDGR